jgi:hypothetical protein
MSSDAPRRGKKAGEQVHAVSQQVSLLQHYARANKAVLKKKKTKLSSAQIKKAARAKKKATRKQRERMDKIVIHLDGCRYPLVKKVAKRLGWRVARNGEPWDVLWADSFDVLNDPSLRVNAIQKINHFPAMKNICRKDFLANCLNAMAKVRDSGHSLPG